MTGLAVAGAGRWAHLAGRRLLTAAVAHLPLAAADALRGAEPSSRSVRRRVRLAVAGLLRRGGIPRAVDVFTLPDNPRLRFVNADSLVLQRLYWFGEQGWEPELLPWWRYLCHRSRSILDLGANVGYYAVQGALAAPHARYVAVEPHPRSVLACRANLALNAVSSVELIEAAAVPEPVGTVELVVPREQLSAPTVAFLSSSAELPAAMVRGPVSVLSVPAVDVRTLLDERGDVDLVKLDVEGQEHELLAAAWEHLRVARPTVVVEVLAGTVRLRALLTRMCRELGYHCYAPSSRGLARVEADLIPTLRLQERFGTNDMILSPDALVGRLPGAGQVSE